MPKHTDLILNPDTKFKVPAWLQKNLIKSLVDGLEVDKDESDIDFIQEEEN